MDEVRDSGAAIALVDGVGERSAKYLLGWVEEHGWMRATSPLIPTVARHTKHGGRRDGGDEPWKAEVMLRGHAVMTPAGPIEWFSPDGTPPPTDVIDGTMVICDENDRPEFYLYGIRVSAVMFA